VTRPTRTTRIPPPPPPPAPQRLYWHPLCAICALCGFRMEAATWIRDHPVCMDHAGLLAQHGLLFAAKQAREDIERVPRETTGGAG